MQLAHAHQAEDEQNRIRYEQCTMSDRRNANAEAAEQYLIWALEELEKLGHRKAARHARIALDELRGAHRITQTPP